MTAKAESQSRNTVEVRVGDAVETVALEEYAASTNPDLLYYGRPGTFDVGIFENVVVKNEYDLPASFSPQDVIVDIGAHIGSFSYAALMRGAGRVYAYEAQPVNHAIAAKNLTRFGERAVCRNRIVWRSDVPDQTLYNSEMFDNPNTGGFPVLWNDEGVPASTIQFDAVLAEASENYSKSIRLLKIDCEGSEYPLLYTSTHLDSVREIRGEYHEITPDSVPPRARIDGRTDNFNREGLQNFLRQAGFSVTIRHCEGSLGYFHARRRRAWWLGGN